eukprot:m.57660 g.57660  ORF g.57660 m.57660 type:complete len:59 (-) comp9366_c0_seq2:1052-1228(-)
MLIATSFQANMSALQTYEQDSFAGDGSNRAEQNASSMRCVFCQTMSAQSADRGSPVAS